MRNSKYEIKTSVCSEVIVKKDLNYAKELLERLRYKDRNDGKGGYNSNIPVNR